MKVKQPVVAGKFYTSDKEELLKQLSHFKSEVRFDYDVTSRAIIVPHAGYIYSGQLAMQGFHYLDKNLENIFIFAPTHYKSENNVLLCDYDKWQTPLGEITINRAIQEEMIKEFGCEYCEFAFEHEHAVEVQIPFIQYLFEGVNIIPVLVGNDDVEKVFKIIEKYWANEKNGFVISSDLSHFLTDEKAKQLDLTTARMIEDNEISQFNYQQACGAVPICALVKFSMEHKFSMIRAGMTNSAKSTGDTSRVVGYGSWFLFEGEKNQFIKKYFGPKVIDICKKTIYAKLTGKTEINLTSYLPYPPVLDSDGACFVTLEKNGNLRGCIGTILAYEPLLINLVKNAYNAAFADPRFKPLQLEEFQDLSIAVSILSNPIKMEFTSEEDLLNQLRVNVDGLIIKDQGKQAVYLPSVWEQLPDKVLFLNSLKQKAGLPQNHFSTTFEAYRYTAAYINEK